MAAVLPGPRRPIQSDSYRHRHGFGQFGSNRFGKLQRHARRARRGRPLLLRHFRRCRRSDDRVPNQPGRADHGPAERRTGFQFDDRGPWIFAVRLRAESRLHGHRSVHRPVHSRSAADHRADLGRFAASSGNAAWAISILAELHSPSVGDAAKRLSGFDDRRLIGQSLPARSNVEHLRHPVFPSGRSGCRSAGVRAILDVHAHQWQSERFHDLDARCVRKFGDRHR